MKKILIVAMATVMSIIYFPYRLLVWANDRLHGKKKSVEQSEQFHYMITKQQRNDLANKGYTKYQVDAMTPKEAHEILLDNNK